MRHLPEKSGLEGESITLIKNIMEKDYLIINRV